MDVKFVFLNSFLKEEVNVKQPQGYEVPRHESKFYILKKALYGLKQAPGAWYNRIDSYLIHDGFSRCNSEPMLYTNMNGQVKILIVCLYGDDVIFTGDLSVDLFKEAMKKEFEMTDLGLIKNFIRIEVKQDESGIFISQLKYANDILKRFIVINRKLARTTIMIYLKLSKDDKRSNVDPTFYKRIVASLMYLVATRPDIMYGVS